MGGGGKQSERKGSMGFVFFLSWGLKISFSLCMGAYIII